MTIKERISKINTRLINFLTKINESFSKVNKLGEVTTLSDATAKIKEMQERLDWWQYTTIDSIAQDIEDRAGTGQNIMVFYGTDTPVLPDWISLEGCCNLLGAFDSSTITKVPMLDLTQVFDTGAGYSFRVVCLDQIFNNCTKLKDISNFFEWDFRGYVASEFPSEVFKGCTGIEFPENWVFPGLKVNPDQKYSLQGLFSGCTSLVSIQSMDLSNCVNASSLFSGCTSLVSVPPLDTSNCVNASSLFNGCTSLVSIQSMDLSNCVNASFLFHRCTSLVSVPPLDTSNCVNASSLFNGCTSLVSIGKDSEGVIHPLDFTSVELSDSFTTRCVSLKEIRFVQNTIKRSIAISSTKVLSQDSIQSIIDGLVQNTGTVSYFLTLNSEVIPTLTAEQSAAITAKGWTLR